MDHHHPWGQGPIDAGAAGHHLFLAPFFGVGMLLLLALVALTMMFLVRRGTIAGPPWLGAGRQRPEFHAREVLAERFANGDISSDEFLERASVLNWTPGVDPLPVQRRRRR